MSDLTAQDQRRARRAYDTVADAGGLVGTADIARRWDISPARARHLVKTDGFPTPLGHINAYPYWLAADVDLWRATRPANGRPRKTPASPS